MVNDYKKAFIAEYKNLCEKYGLSIMCDCGWSSYVVCTNTWLEDQINQIDDGTHIRKV